MFWNSNSNLVYFVGGGGREGREGGLDFYYVFGIPIPI